MSIIKRNIIANFGGNIWAGLMGLVFIPLYIRFMGIEAYGLVGVFASLQAMFALLDMGLSQTMVKELARLSILPEKTKEMRNFVRTLEIPYWLVGFLIAGIVIISSSFIANHWVKVEKLSPDIVHFAIIIMGLTMAFQWPLSLYSGGLAGLQNQVRLNIINIVMTTIRGGGAVLILWLISPTIEAFFYWQLIISIIHTCLMAVVLWNSLPFGIEPARFKISIFKEIWRFAAGISGIAFLSTILMQSDKIILSKMLTLEMFGYYTLAQVASSILYRFIAPISAAIYPQMSRLGSIDSVALARLYHKSAQLVSVIILPTAFIISFFSRELLLLWTHNSMTTANTYLLLSILVIGTAFNGIMNIPGILMFSHGWTKLSFYTNIISVLLMVPFLFLITKYYGVLGAASAWVLLNFGYILIVIPLMHKRLIPNEKWRWYFVDVGIPFTVALIVTVFFRYTIPLPSNNLYLFICILIISILTLLLTTLSTPVTRQYIQNAISTITRKNDVKS